MRAIERADHRQVDQAPVATLQSRSAPDTTPAILRGEFLHGATEVVGTGEGLFHVLLAEHGLADFQSALIQILVHDLLPRLGEISQPARSSTVRAILVQSESGPNLSCVSASTSRTALPSSIGTPSAAASSRQRRTSLSARPVENPKSKPRVSTYFGNLSAEAVLRPLDALSTSSINCGSRPAFTPSASASDVMAMAA